MLVFFTNLGLMSECPVNAGVPQSYILGATLFLVSINDLPDNVIRNITNFADDTTLYSKCDQTSDFGNN